MVKEAEIIDFDTAKKALTAAGGSVIDENWLANLPVGSVFLSQRKNTPKDNAYPCDLYAVLEHKTMSSNLAQKLPTGQQVDLWFRTLEFSRMNNKVEVIATVEFGYETKEEAPEKKETPDEGSVS